MLRYFVRQEECEPGARHTFKRSLKIASGTLLASWLLSFIPWIGFPMAIFGWFFVIDDLYTLSWKRTLMLFIMQFVAGCFIAVVLFFLLLFSPLGMVL
ncbi:MAG: hypothetical protein AAFS10_04690 [Myxococcota bacterium]